eukprot:6382040-Amphidinium_carterae.1
MFIQVKAFTTAPTRARPTPSRANRANTAFSLLLSSYVKPSLKGNNKGNAAPPSFYLGFEHRHSM